MKHETALFVLVLAICAFTQKHNFYAVGEENPVIMEKNCTINSTMECIVSVSNLPDDLSKSPPRILVDCPHCEKMDPAIITIKQRRSITAFELPIIFKVSDNHHVVYNKTERTLCSYEGGDLLSGDQYENSFSYLATDSENSILTVALSTSSKKTVTVYVKVTLVTDFLLKLNENKTITLTPTTPSFYLYEFPNDSEEESVILEVKSEFNNCMVISIQNQSCPLVERGISYHNGYFQTVTHLGGMTIKKNMFPMGFYALLSLRPDDSYCLPPTALKNTQRSKTVAITLYKSISTEHYVYVVVGTICVILLVYAVMIGLTSFCFMRKDFKIPALENCTHDLDEPSTPGHLQGPSTFNYSNDRDHLKITSPTGEDTISVHTDSSLDETDLDILTEADIDKNIFRTKLTLYLSDMAKKNPTVLKKKSELYFWNLMTVAIFYGLPASQVVFTYQSTLYDSGNQDLCYYNFLCSHPLGQISDFNHIFSNIGYVALGILFIIITRRKDLVHRALVCQDNRLDRTYGVPQHFGLYYAMGTALIIEGLLSACYHVCPNIYSFQFDASFMYIISILSMIKIYQSRHPDVNATAYSTFFFIALVLFLQICGIFTSFFLLFWIVFTTVHLGTLSYISLKIYYVGRFEFDWRSVIRYFKEFQFRVCGTVRFWRPLYPKRFCLLSVINLCNWGLAIGAIIIGVKDVSSYLILIFIANLMMYTTFYIIMKILSGEKILLQPCIYTVLAVLCWSAALFYFFRKTISWKKTPAESREYNKRCELFDFYDYHDIWHFISSGGLFFSFLVLLTLDDDLIFVNRSKIPVF